MRSNQTQQDSVVRNVKKMSRKLQNKTKHKSPLKESVTEKQRGAEEGLPSLRPREVR